MFLAVYGSKFTCVLWCVSLSMEEQTLSNDYAYLMPSDVLLQ